MCKKIGHVGLIIIVVSLVVISPRFTSIVSAEGTKWSQVAVPTNGAAGDWVLASGSDLRCLTVAADGTLYCYANPAGTTTTLYKSTDNGYQWASIGKVTDNIIDIAIVPGELSTIYYATASRVYRSIDGGTTFMQLPLSPGNAGTGNAAITSIDAVKYQSIRQIAVGTSDPDTGKYGGVYLYNEALAVAGWQNTACGNYDVRCVTFSPDYDNDRTLTAIVSNETSTRICWRVGDNPWGQTIGDAVVGGAVSLSASLAFPQDYTQTHAFFLSNDTGINRGDIYRVQQVAFPQSSIAAALAVGQRGGLSGIDFNSIAVTGKTDAATIVAGCKRSTDVLVSRDGGTTWNRAQKPPTGQSDTCLIASTDGKSFYAVTRGNDSAFSVSSDYGLTWNQRGLIDTGVNRLSDLTVVKKADSETVLLMITRDNSAMENSLWRSSDDGAHWERVFSSTQTNVDSFSFIKTIPNSTSFALAGQYAGSPALWISNDMGATFSVRLAPCAVSAWEIVDKDTFFIGGSDASRGLFYCSNNGGMSWAFMAEVGTKALNGIAVSPNFTSDKMVVAGNIAGQVFRSTDGGLSFVQLGQTLPVASGTGKVFVAYASDGTLYAAVDTKVTAASKERVFRLTTGANPSWTSIAGNLPVDAFAQQLLFGEGGILYCSNGQDAVAADSKGGLLRWLTPDASATTCEVVLRGIDDSTGLKIMAIDGNRIWAFDMKNNRLLVFIDGLTAPVISKLPETGAQGINITTRLTWEPVSDADEYEWQLNEEPAFSSLPATWEGSIGNIYARPTSLMGGVKYYWRVRVSKPYLSPWSEIQNFTTLPSGMDVAPQLIYPAAGDMTGVRPVFQWQAIQKADRYELVVAQQSDFSQLFVERMGSDAVPTNAWTSDIDFRNGASYFWRVRACSGTSIGGWSATGVFVIGDLPVVTTTADGMPQNVAKQVQSTATPTVTMTAVQTVLPSVMSVQFEMPGWAVITGAGIIIAVLLFLGGILVILMRQRQ